MYSKATSKSVAAQIFEKDWSTFQLKKKAIEACDCKKGKFCSCFMQHEQGRELFADHCSRRKHLFSEMSRVNDKLSSLETRTFYILSGTLPGCKCPSENCDCVKDSNHPMNKKLLQQYAHYEAPILNAWNDKLREYGVSCDDPEFFIGPKIEPEMSVKKRKASFDFSDAEAQYSPTSPSYSPEVPSYSPTSPSYLV